MSTPTSRIQSGIAYQTRPSGRPDANDRTDTAIVRWERRASRRGGPATVPGRIDGVWSRGTSLALKALQTASAPEQHALALRFCTTHVTSVRQRTIEHALARPFDQRLVAQCRVARSRPRRD